MVERQSSKGFDGVSTPFSSSLSKSRRLAQMYGDHRYCDLTVRVGSPGAEETFCANRTLLARCSEVFGKMLFEQRMQEEQHAEVHIADCSPEAFRQLLRCAHDLDAQICDRNFVEVFQLARKYDAEDLLEAVRAWMASAAEAPATAIRALDAAQGLQGSPVEEEVATMLELCIDTVVASAEVLIDEGAFACCSSATMATLLKQDRLCCDEEHLWLALVEWGKMQADPTALRSVVPHVRFNIMSPDFFVDRVVTVNVLEDKEVIELLSARSTGRAAKNFQGCANPRNGIVGAYWRCSRATAEAFEYTGQGCTVTRNNYPHWKRALGRWNCDDKMQRGLVAQFNASFSVRIDHLVTQKGRYSGDVLLGVARPDIAPDDHSETRNNSVPAWVYSCRDGTLVAPHCIAPMRMTPAVEGDVMRFELRGGKLFITRNGDSMGMAFDDVIGPVVPVVEMNLAGSRVTLC